MLEELAQAETAAFSNRETEISQGRIKLSEDEAQRIIGDTKNYEKIKQEFINGQATEVLLIGGPKLHYNKNEDSWDVTGYGGYSDLKSLAKMLQDPNETNLMMEDLTYSTGDYNTLEATQLIFGPNKEILKLIGNEFQSNGQVFYLVGGIEMQVSEFKMGKPVFRLIGRKAQIDKIKQMIAAGEDVLDYSKTQGVHPLDNSGGVDLKKAV